jgi:branched-subunit amino acid aminotransferase/4-amino-4-deoxychorismate lyase
VLKKTDIVRADEIKLINSVRKWIPVCVVDTLR